MSRAKVQRLQRVLKYEQRELDKFIQNVSIQSSKLSVLETELEKLDRRRECAMVEANQLDFYPEFASNRNAWSDRINQIFLGLMVQKKTAIEKVHSAQQEVRKQKARVKAIEMLISATLQKRLASQQLSENVELIDTALNRFLEPQ